ncbi:DNA mismatch endonuclease Vsr [Flavobacteriaceae bacterium D16]|nr:DNA mismatch endonuclease Vsr [Flavobacteriaceae bacterium D16]
MTDIFSKKKRSSIMSKISGKETKPEILVRKFLFSNGFRYRKNVNGLSGKPDIVLSKYKSVVFVNGCFWHGHNCKAGKLPSTKKEFWKTKIADTIKRDQKNYSDLSDLGWKVMVIWQCELKNKELKETRLSNLIKEIID